MVKYEEVYLRTYASVSLARGTLADILCLAFYNSRTPSSSLERADTPSGIYQTVAINPGGGITEWEIKLLNGSKLF